MLKNIFNKSRRRKYVSVPSKAVSQDLPEGIMTKCPTCKKIMYTKELQANFSVCIHCSYHHPIQASERISQFIDEGTFIETDGNLQTENPLDFPDYLEKITKDKEKTGLNEAIITGTGSINGDEISLAVMDSTFRMGSMGSVVGEKITRAVELAEERSLPFLIFTASGGARMQEGVLSLMQMAKTSAALKRFSDQGGLFISIMTHPTTGGVSASFASLGDYNLAEPGALIGFAGRRIIEQTIREDLPEDFQTAEFLLKHGQLDAVINRSDLKDEVSKIIKLHRPGGDVNDK